MENKRYMPVARRAIFYIARLPAHEYTVHKLTQTGSTPPSAAGSTNERQECASHVVASALRVVKRLSPLLLLGRTGSNERRLSDSLTRARNVWCTIKQACCRRTLERRRRVDPRALAVAVFYAARRHARCGSSGGRRPSLLLALVCAARLRIVCWQKEPQLFYSYTLKTRGHRAFNRSRLPQRPLFGGEGRLATSNGSDSRSLARVSALLRIVCAARLRIVCWQKEPQLFYCVERAVRGVSPSLPSDFCLASCGGRLR